MGARGAWGRRREVDQKNRVARTPHGVPPPAARRKNSTDVETREAETIAAKTMDVLDVDTDTLDAGTLGPQSAASAVRAEPYGSHALDLLIVLSRRKEIILRTTLAAAVLASIVSLLLRNRYTATANILPPQQSQSLAASMVGQLGAFGPMAAMAQEDLGLKNSNDL